LNHLENGRAHQIVFFDVLGPFCIDFRPFLIAFAKQQKAGIKPAYVI
jgi:hypothetical protein